MVRYPVTKIEAQGNAGNTILGKGIPDFASQTFTIEKDIPVGTLDEIMWSNPSLPPPHIRVLKLDTQGYEVNILKGARRLLAAGAVGVIKTELTRTFLEAQGTSKEELFSILQEYGYEYASYEGDFPIDDPNYAGELLLKRKVE
jgi:hypothetical protein